MARKKRKHCWHSTGQGMTWGFSGGELQHRCCHCGALVNVSWSESHMTIKGHGPHVSSRETKYDWSGIATQCDPERLPLAGLAPVKL